MSWSGNHCLPRHGPPTKADSGARSSSSRRYDQWAGSVVGLMGVTADTGAGGAAAAEPINKHVPCSFGLCDQDSAGYAFGRVSGPTISYTMLGPDSLRPGPEDSSREGDWLSGRGQSRCR